MTRKAPRRTAERIRATALALFNRFGEPNVSTTALSGELNISPGNLYYHYPSKDELINSLFDSYALAMDELLAASDGVRDAEDTWFFLHSLFELVWDYRFFYRDLNHLLSRNRHLEQHFPDVLARKKTAFGHILAQLGPSGQAEAHQGLAASMVVLLTWWLSYEYVLQPRSALEPENAQDALLRGAWHVSNLLLPHIDAAQSEHLAGLLQAYRAPTLD